jgi:ATP-dependent DNA helicase RecG
MSDPIKLLEGWMQEKEDERLEFKSARNKYDFEELTRYCVALANEGGGRIILGVSDKRPRQVVGTKAFDQPERTCSGLNQRLHLNIDFEEVIHPKGRVLAFHVPHRPAGVAIQWDGQFWVRDGDSLVGMSSDRLREIFAEAGHDFSADFCEGLTIADLVPGAIEEFRRRWVAKSGNAQLATLSHAQLLSDIGVVNGVRVTYAALILLGSREAVRTHLAQAEVVYEYRINDASGPAGERHEFQEGFFAWFDMLWEHINGRNINQHFQEGPFVLDMTTFDERPIREAILNAVSHRNYQLGGSVFIRQYADRIEFDSPGGFPVEIRLDNILHRQAPRNRRIAEVFALCGLVERAGQGVNLMYESAIRQSKMKPDFSRTDQYTVSLTLSGRMRNPAFVQFLRQFDAQTLESLSTDDWLTLDALSHEEPLSDGLLPRAEHLLQLGMIVRVGNGRFILNEPYYRFQHREETFRRLREGEGRKELLESRIAEHAVDGVAIGDLQPLLPELNRDQVRRLLDELRREDRVHFRGEKRWTRWYPGPLPGEESEAGT